MSLKVLMFGWEFPPYKSGGLGTACYGLTKGLAMKNCKITFVTPVAPEGAKAEFVKLVPAQGKNIRIKQVNSLLAPYQSAEGYKYQYGKSGKKMIYSRDIFNEVQRYAVLAGQIAKAEEHDIIHAHDWMSYPAAISAQKISKKPLVAHLHATEFDRTGGNPNPMISHIEWTGLKEADKIITNSQYSKNNIIKYYGIKPEKIEVVHWGIDEVPAKKFEKNIKEKTVLFLGRLTIQKGPDYFIETAKKVLEHEPNTKFVIAGEGDMLPSVINRAAELGITDKMIFTGALAGEEVHKAFQTADLYVMPSVSEPFGLVALESLKNKTPILISKQSGVSEVVRNALKSDFWDVNDMANKIVNVLRHDALREELRENGTKEAQKFNLAIPAEKTMKIYAEVLNGKH